MGTAGVLARVVVVERRRLFREGLVLLLGDVPSVEVVDAVAVAEDLPGIAEPFDHVLTSIEVPASVLEPGTAVIRYTDAHSSADLVAMLSHVPASVAGPCGVLPPTAGTRRLTPREVDVMRGIADGLSSAEIAAGLRIAPKSVENHKQRIFAKLRVRSQAHAVMVSIADGLLLPSVTPRNAGPSRG